ncbi:hypothetical protein ACKU27_23205 [Sphingobium yanoikuyae]|uniref:hypothetical protein n=1 Tax=Sphingobium yanoikuyae TaxID=13690 RepID=UPI003B8FC710
MKRFLKWTLVVLFLGVAAVTGVVSVIKHNQHVDELNDEYNRFISDLNQLQGVKIGDSQKELLYANGNPNIAHFPDGHPDRPKDDSLSLYMGGTGKKMEDFPAWVWFLQGGGQYTANFDLKTGKVVGINCIYIDTKHPYTCLTVKNINLGELNHRSESYIKCALGNPDREEYDTVSGNDGDVNRKILAYDTLGLQFVMISREAVNITKWATEAPSFSWWLERIPNKPC